SARAGRGRADVVEAIARGPAGVSGQWIWGSSVWLAGALGAANVAQERGHGLMPSKAL
ncbi:hypothetical protein THAOC_19311, partial [Thalassiosira oceanica]